MTDLKEGWLLRNLSFGEVLAILASRPRAADDVLLFWSEGWSAWKELNDPECHPFRTVRVESQSPPPIPLLPEIQEDTLPPMPIAVRARKASSSRGGGPLPRKFDRFPMQLPVVIQTTTDQFSTWSLDVSEGGIRIRDELPESIAGYTEVVLMPKNHTPFYLLASLVEDQQDGRFHLQFMDSPAQIEFITWLRDQKLTRVG